MQTRESKKNHYYSAITTEMIDISKLNELALDESCGAVLSFSGNVRNSSHGLKVIKLAYDAYEPMALKQINKIIEDVFKLDEGIKKIQVVHRIGEISGTSSSIYITVTSKHRPEGFLALRTLIDRIKQDVPIWKKEFYENGETQWLHPCANCEHH